MSAALSASIPAPEREYILGTNDAELWRLGFQHRLWARLASDAWERARFGRGQRILDVGCGPGYATLDLSELVNREGRVVAVDVSSRFVTYLSAKIAAMGVTNVEPLLGDVQTLDLEPGQFDGAWARWVLCFVEDPAAVVHAVARTLRPGGRFVVQDYYLYRALTLAPRNQIVKRIAEAVDQSVRIRGGDPDVGQRLPGMMADAGMRVESVRPILRTARPHDALWQWPRSFFRNYVPVLLEMSLITQDDADAFEQAWDASERDPNAVFYTPPMTEVIAVKA